MKICWDMLEGITLIKSGIFVKGSNYLVYKESCVSCGNTYLTVKSYNSPFCSRSCAQTGINNHRYGKGAKDEDNPMYKGGTIKLQRPLYDTYAYRLEFCESCRRSMDNKLFMDVKCVYCGNWFSCSLNQAVDRTRFIEGKKEYEAKFYCSDGCRMTCPIHSQKLYPKGFKKASSREVQPELRQLVLKRDNYSCQICGKSIDEVELHCHHIEGVEQNPIESADVDVCITLCKEHHKKVHKSNGCRYVDMRCGGSNYDFI